MISDILHTLNVGMRQHLMHWVASLFKQHSQIDKFNQLWAMIPPLPGFTHFNTPYSQVTNGVVRRQKPSGISLFQCSWGLFQTVCKAKGFALQKPCCVSRT